MFEFESGFNSHQSFGQCLNVLANLTNLTNLFSSNLGGNPIEFTFGRDKDQRKNYFCFRFRSNTNESLRRHFITRKGCNFAYVESLCRGTNFLVVFIQIAPVHSIFDIKLGNADVVIVEKLTKYDDAPHESNLLVPHQFVE